MTKRSHKGDVGTVFRDVVQEAGRALGLGPSVCADLAVQAEDRLRLRAGGTVIYVGMADRRARDALIRAEFNGENHSDLAEKHNLSERRIQQIVQK